MRWLLVASLVLPAVVGCGGVAKRDSNAQGEAGGSAMPQGNLTETIDDMNPAAHQYPAVPPGSSGFFWRFGLGNWFVVSSDGVFQDAPIEAVTLADGSSARACHASSMGQGVGVDLWAQLNHPTGKPVDLSAYSGVAVSARLTGANSTLTVAFDAKGQVPQGDATVPQQTFMLGADWQTLSLRFADVGQDSSAVSSVDFMVTAPQAPFDLWVRDLVLLCSKTCP